MGACAAKQTKDENEPRHAKTTAVVAAEEEDPIITKIKGVFNKSDITLTRLYLLSRRSSVTSKRVGVDLRMHARRNR